MVYGFAKQSNGAFLLDSEPGEGTTAELWLPRAPHKKAMADPPASEEAPCAKPGKMRSLRVLLVDDHEEVRSTTAAMLSDCGHHVVEAATGTKAVEVLNERECDFDLMITDYAMPNVSGAEFLRKARELCPNVPALMITGYADAEAISDRPEGVEILLKPFTPRKLEAAIERVCEPRALVR
jgi:CheY-like chemotaxis protein